MTDLNGKTTALVTGSTSGIGAAVAHRLADGDAYVLICGRDRRRGDAVVDSIRATGGRADFIQSELAGAAGARELASAALGLAGGPIDVLVNNAAVGAVSRPTAGFPEEAFDAVMATNLKAPFYLVSELAPAMAAQGQGRDRQHIQHRR